MKLDNPVGVSASPMGPAYLSVTLGCHLSDHVVGFVICPRLLAHLIFIPDFAGSLRNIKGFCFALFFYSWTPPRFNEI